MASIIDVNKEVSNELSISKEDVVSINDFYWKEVRTTIDSISYSGIYLRSIGTFYLKNKSMYNKIIALIRYVRKIEVCGKYSEAKKEIIINHNKQKIGFLFKNRHNASFKSKFKLRWKKELEK
jgi:hypothetical protein